MKLFSITSLEERNFLPVSRAFAMFGIKDPSQCVKCVRGNSLEIYESRSGRSCFSICSQNNRRFGRSCSRKKKRWKTRTAASRSSFFMHYHRRCHVWRDKQGGKLNITSLLEVINIHAQPRQNQMKIQHDGSDLMRW